VSAVENIALANERAGAGVSRRRAQNIAFAKTMKGSLPSVMTLTARSNAPIRA